MKSSATPATSEQSIGFGSESQRHGLAEQVYRGLIGDKEKCEEILARVKWSMGVNKRNGKDVPWNPDATRGKLSGNLRGLVAEAVSEKLSLLDIQTVFSSKDPHLEGLSVVSPQEFAGSGGNKKGDVLAHMLEESLREKPLQMFDPTVRMPNNPIIAGFKKERLESKAPQVTPQEYGRLLRDYMARIEEETNDQIVKGYTYAPVREKGGSVTPAGELYVRTVIPDALILDQGTPVGLVEVKAYQADELAKLLTLIRTTGKEGIRYTGHAGQFGKTYPGAENDPYSLGADLDGEVAFVDILRGLAGLGTERDSHNLVVLRFPADIPDNLLIQYGVMIVSYGFRNVIIQKLPFSGEELDVIARELVKAQWPDLNSHSSKGNFSNRELEVLKQYADIEV